MSQHVTTGGGRTGGRAGELSEGGGREKGRK